MKELMKYILLLAIFSVSPVLCAQDAAADNNVIRGTVVSRTEGPLMQVNVTEIDANDRILSATVTDMNGEFSLKIKNTRNSLQFKYVGYKPKKIAIGETKVFSVEMEEDNVMEEFVFSARKTTNTGALDIPERELSMATQKISTKEFEGTSAASIDDMLQGRIAGLDIVSMSGDLGGGMNMRLRGESSLTGNKQPLIVVDGIPFNPPQDALSGIDFATATEEQYATLLQISPDDIETITVLKDAASSAIWGGDASAGVIQFTTKKGARGRTTVQYSYKYSGKWQPKGYKLLNGDEYTMFMKEAYFNPQYNANASNLPELSYRPLNQFLYANEFNDNTDWVDLVTQYGQTHDHYVTVSGGAEKARFRVSGGYYNETGTAIKQELTRYTSRMNLDYYVSRRLKFTTEFAFTFTDNDQNYDGLLGIAQRKMPNLSPFKEDENGNDTKEYFAYPVYDRITMPLKDPIAQTSDIGGQDGLVNPLASAALAQKNSKTYSIVPTFRINYDFLNPEQGSLTYQGHISFNVNNSHGYSYRPKALDDGNWANLDQNAQNSDNKSLNISSRHALTYVPKFETRDHSLSIYGAADISMNNSIGQTVGSNRLPSGIYSPSVGTYLSGLSSGPGRGRSAAFLGTVHYAYLGKYIIDATARYEGTTKLAKGNKFFLNPGISTRWNVTDEKFMDFSKDWLNMWALRASWGITGNNPSGEGVYYSKYSANNGYINTSGLYPNNIRLANLNRERTQEWNFGSEIELFNGLLGATVDVYNRNTTDQFVGFPIPSSSGYSSYQANSGSVQNKGWEVNLNANRFIRSGDFSVDWTFNIANNINIITEMDPLILDMKNVDYNYANGTYLSRTQVDNPVGSIYGFEYKGVYQYNYSYKNTERQGRKNENYAGEPVARDKEGNVIYDENGAPKHMVFRFGNANQYTFAGGDAIYKDINNDGNIDALDIKYLGNHNPDFNGGMGFKFRYKRLSLNVFSNFRYGNKVINMARLNLESMRDANNQVASINWRWRKDGDITEMPRALFQYGYNSLGSDRYMEDGSFWRIKYITVNYSIDPRYIKKYYLTQMSFYFTFNNIVTFTKYSGVDPEVLNTDNSQTPRSRYFTAGITLGF